MVSRSRAVLRYKMYFRQALLFIEKKQVFIGLKLILIELSYGRYFLRKNNV
jgi:hypothetical protein